MSGFLGGGIGAGGAPGHLSPFDTSVANAAAGQSIQAMANRYNQLGLGGPGQGGGTPTNAGTAEAMDLGILPSYTGGIPAQFQALTGELQNNALATPGSAGKGTSPASLIGGAGSILGGK
jgi:hypothetical protein